MKKFKEMKMRLNKSYECKTCIRKNEIKNKY